MATSLRASSSNGASLTAAQTLQVTKPSGVAQGDMLLFFVWGSAVDITLPSGLTLLDDENDGTHYRSFYKVATDSEPSTYDFYNAASSARTVLVGILAYYNASGDISIDAHGGQYTGATYDTTQTCPSITTGHDNALVIRACVVNPDSTGTQTASLAAHTETLDACYDMGGSYNYLVAAYHAIAGAAGPTGTADIITTKNNTGGGFTVSLHTDIEGEAALQGVASISEAASSLGAVGASALQGVASIVAEAEGTPAIDFSRFDGYIEDSDGALGLIYYEAEGARKETVSRPLQPTRQDVGNNPYEIRPESGNPFSQGDFSHGGFQTYFHREDSNFRRFLRSEGFDISEPGQLTHLHKAASSLGDVNVGAMAMSNGYLFVASGQDVKKHDGSFPGNWTSEDPEAGGTPSTVNDLTSSGDVLYAALGAEGIHKRIAAGTWSHYSDVLATRIAWLKGRLMAADGTKIYEITSGPGAPTEIETLPSGWTFESMFEAGAFIYACAINTDIQRSVIHIFAENDGLTAIEKRGEQAFPEGQLVYSGCGYLNTVFLGAGKLNSSGGYDPILYRAAPETNSDSTSNGFLEYIKIAEEEGAGSTNLAVKAFAPMGESVLCGWSQGTGCLLGAARGGLGIYNLGRASFTSHLRASTSGDAIKDIVVHKGRVCFVVSGVGVYYEDLDNYEPTATLITSVGDWKNAGQKEWNSVEVAHGVLPADTRVKLHYATEVPASSTTWSEALVSSSGTGSSVRLSNLRSRLLAIKLISEADAAESAAPLTLSYTVRSYPYPATQEFLLSRYVRLQDRDQKDSLAEPVVRDASADRRRLLLVANSTVKLYEPGITWYARVESVGDVEPYLAPFDPLGDNTRDLYVLRLALSATIA